MAHFDLIRQTHCDEKKNIKGWIYNILFCFQIFICFISLMISLFSETIIV